MSAPDCPAWWCPACCIGIELGEEAWSGSLAPIPGVTEPECGDCGTELEVHPEIVAWQPEAKTSGEAS
jgi:hypothetical protein